MQCNQLNVLIFLLLENSGAVVVAVVVVLDSQMDFNNLILRHFVFSHNAVVAVAASFLFFVFCSCSHLIKIDINSWLFHSRLLVSIVQFG